MRERGIIMDKKNWIEIIEFGISVSIITQDTNYDYNDEFLNPV